MKYMSLQSYIENVNIYCNIKDFEKVDKTLRMYPYLYLW